MVNLKSPGTSLVIQWLRIRLSTQGTRVGSLVWEDTTCQWATKPTHHNYWATGSRACELQLLKPAHPGACALQREATAMRSPGTTEELPPLTTTRERPSTVTKIQASQKTKTNRSLKKKKELAFLMAFVVSLFSRSVMPNSLWPHGLQYAKLLCSLPSPRVCSNPCPLSQGCHPAISSSVISFSCLQSSPPSGSFPMSWLFSSGGQSIGASASTSVLPMNILGWFPLGLTALISLCPRNSQESSLAP